MKKIAILLSILLVLTLFLAACTDNREETKQTSVLPPAVEHESNTHHADDTETTPTRTEAAETLPSVAENPETPSTIPEKAETTGLPEEVEDTDVEIVENYTVTVDGPVGIGGD